jgi:hypothetical protein
MYPLVCPGLFTIFIYLLLSSLNIQIHMAILYFALTTSKIVSISSFFYLRNGNAYEAIRGGSRGRTRRAPP